MKRYLSGRLARIGATFFIYGYVVGRFISVYGVFAPYHVNPWVFLVLDLVTAWPYAYAIPRLIEALLVKRQERRVEAVIWWASVVAASFAAPYVYVAFAAQNVPWELITGLSVFVALMLSLCGWKIYQGWLTGKEVKDAPIT